MSQISAQSKMLDCVAIRALTIILAEQICRTFYKYTVKEITCEIHELIFLSFFLHYWKHTPFFI